MYRNKFGNRKITVDGVTFDSKAEYDRWIELKILNNAGLISSLRRQVPYVIIPKSRWGRAIKYIADFDYMEDGKHVIEDKKGYTKKDPLYRLKKRLVAEVYGIEIRET